MPKVQRITKAVLLNELQMDTLESLKKEAVNDIIDGDTVRGSQFQQGYKQNVINALLRRNVLRTYRKHYKIVDIPVALRPVPKPRRAKIVDQQNSEET